MIFNTTSFITRWKVSGASERANYQLFLSELCELLQVEKPRPASDKVHEADYTFERPVEFNDGEGKITTNFIDLYKRHCFVLEAKQGSDKAMVTEAELLGAERAKTATELPEWPKNLAEQAQAVQRMLQQFNHPISAADINRKFVEAKKEANALREQQIGHILATISTLGLLWKTAEVFFVRQRSCLT